MNKKKNDSQKVCRDNFLSHLEKSADKVRSWPEWMQESLGSSGYLTKCSSSSIKKKVSKIIQEAERS